jgi:hypothetical protein
MSVKLVKASIRYWPSVGYVMYFDSDQSRHLRRIKHAEFTIDADGMEYTVFGRVTWSRNNAIVKIADPEVQKFVDKTVKVIVKPVDVAPITKTGSDKEIMELRIQLEQCRKKLEVYASLLKSLLGAAEGQ